MNEKKKIDKTEGEREEEREREKRRGRDKVEKYNKFQLFLLETWTTLPR
jgi:hypothetical protein